MTREELDDSPVEIVARIVALLESHSTPVLHDLETIVRGAVRSPRRREAALELFTGSTATQVAKVMSRPPQYE